MNTNVNVTQLPMVIKSSTIELKKGFLKNNFCRAKWQSHAKATPRIIMMILTFLLFNTLVTGQTIVSGGKTKIPRSTSFGSNNETTYRIVNNTGMAAHDIWIMTLDGNLKNVTVTPGLVASTKITSHVNKKHFTFTGKVPQGGQFAVTIQSTAPNDTIEVILTDSLGAGIMRNLNQKNDAATGNNGIIPSDLCTITGGKQRIQVDPINFASLNCINQTEQDICDLRIMNARTANGTAVKIDSVYVNDSKVSTTSGNGAIHVFFPCVPHGGKLKISVKFSGTNEVVTYDVLPTNADTADIVTIPDNYGNTSTKAAGAAGTKTNKTKVGKTIKFTDATGAKYSSSRPSFTFTNKADAEVCDLILVVPSPKKITKVKVNGNEWQTNPAGQQASKVHVYAGNNPCIAKDGKATVTVYVDGAVSEVTYTPTDSNNNQIATIAFNGSMATACLTNAYASLGLSARSASVVAINESCSPITQLVFSSPNPGINVVMAASSMASAYANNVLTFYNPIPPGGTIDFWFRVNQLVPFNATDTFPYTQIDICMDGCTAGFGTIDITNAMHASASTGALNLSVNNDVALSYLWSNGATTEDIANLLPGTYTVTVTTPLSCFSASAIVSANGTPSVEVFPFNQWCASAANGGGFAIVKYLVEPIAISWDNGEVGNMAGSMLAGTHFTTVTDATGLTLTFPFAISSPSNIQVNGATTRPTCNGYSNGSINVTTIGGAGDYTYRWNSGSTLEDRINMKAGYYTVSVKDGYGCTAPPKTFQIKQPAILAATGFSFPAQCHGTPTGSATITTTGGTAPYLYQWSNGMTTASISNLVAGTYQVAIQDNKGCGTNYSIIVSQPPPLNVMAMQIGPMEAMAQVTGGIPPYNIMWNTNPPQNGPVANNLLPNHMYMVNVIDANGCMSNDTVFIGGSKIANNLYGNVDIIIYPQPADQELTFELTGISNEIVQVDILDLSGKLVKTIENIFITNGITKIDCSGISSGTYLIKISSKNLSKMTKVAVQH